MTTFLLGLYLGGFVAMTCIVWSELQFYDANSAVESIGFVAWFAGLWPVWVPFVGAMKLWHEGGLGCALRGHVFHPLGWLCLRCGKDRESTQIIQQVEENGR